MPETKGYIVLNAIVSCADCDRETTLYDVAGINEATDTLEAQGWGYTDFRIRCPSCVGGGKPPPRVLNLNCTVRVRPTDVGLKILEAERERLGVLMDSTIPAVAALARAKYPVRDDGTVRMTFWEAMQIFGGRNMIQGREPIDMNVAPEDE